jgi:hypothetical protein
VQDIVSLEGGRDWWSQIEDVLKATRLGEASQIGGDTITSLFSVAALT